jgi:hypothetical protein
MLYNLRHRGITFLSNKECLVYYIYIYISKQDYIYSQEVGYFHDNLY